MRRTGLAVLALALVAMPATAAAQDSCRAIRALTNADGRHFADLVLGVARGPQRMSVRAGRDQLTPAPENCDISADADDVDVSCYWRAGDYAATSALFDQLLNRFQECLGGRLEAAHGPAAYGDARALRQSETRLALGGGETSIGLFLIESPNTAQVASYHYITVSVSHAPAEPDA